MPLSRGTMLGPYEILSLVGAGGMGEVYRARDTRLDREVAIKVSGAQFGERFEREARAVAAPLNHPNICTLHDIGPNYLVMELVEGQTLAGATTEFCPIIKKGNCLFWRRVHPARSSRRRADRFYAPAAARADALGGPSDGRLRLALGPPARSTTSTTSTAAIRAASTTSTAAIRAASGPTSVRGARHSACSTVLTIVSADTTASRVRLTLEGWSSSGRKTLF
jgi:hypothetical protein